MSFAPFDTVFETDTALGPVGESLPYPKTKSKCSHSSRSKEITELYKCDALRTAIKNAERCAAAEASEGVLTLLYKLRKNRPDLWNATGMDSSSEDWAHTLMKRLERDPPTNVIGRFSTAQIEHILL